LPKEQISDTDFVIGALIYFVKNTCIKLALSK